MAITWELWAKFLWDWALSQLALVLHHHCYSLINPPWFPKFEFLKCYIAHHFTVSRTKIKTQCFLFFFYIPFMNTNFFFENFEYPDLGKKDVFRKQRNFTKYAWITHRSTPEYPGENLFTVQHPKLRNLKTKSVWSFWNSQFLI